MTISDINAGTMPHEDHVPEVIDHKGLGEESLAPQETRIMDPWSCCRCSWPSPSAAR
jgi:NCS1 family nucleobase:cation symporter-1